MTLKNFQTNNIDQNPKKILWAGILVYVPKGSPKFCETFTCVPWEKLFSFMGSFATLLLGFLLQRILNSRENILVTLVSFLDFGVFTC